ncbi:MAG TPA: hypothetical protein VM120_17965 [Bryobacteraceae bacterium]|nr:hypothetical protein [Bryobacteraceae bacterium]
MNLLLTLGLSLWLAPVSISLENGVFEVRGVADSSHFEAFSVSVDGRQGLPSLAGSHQVINKSTIRFIPRYPLQPGMTYRASYQSVMAVFSIPKADVKPTTRVERIYPTAAELPANVLKLYVQFSAPMSRAEAWRHIHLIDEQGTEVKLPFLEIEEELWDRETRRLTVLFDPGRIKRGLVPHNEAGPALIAGRRYQIVIDREWLDGTGTPMAAEYRKPFRVRAEDRTPPSVSNWKLQPPRAGSWDALQLDFPEPLDAALLQRLLWVEEKQGRRVEGKVQVENQEARWLFQPAAAWNAGHYVLRAGTLLEDLAGNRIDRLFDVDAFEKVEMRTKEKTKAIPFQIKR